MNKKAQGISINVVVLAAIALIILVILILLAVNSGKRVSGTTGDSSCLAQGGQCMAGCDKTAGYDEIISGNSYCANDPLGRTFCCRYDFAR